MSEEKCFCHLNGYVVKDATARKDLENVNTNIAKIKNKNLASKRFVVFGDSYLLGYQVGAVYDETQSWGYKLQTRLGISNENFCRTGTTGGSFANPNGTHWQDQVEAVSIASPETVDYVVLVGGTNDYESTYTDLENAITIFANKCRAKFPNALIAIGCIVGHTRHWGITKTFNTILNYKKACLKNGIAFMSGIEYTVRHMAYMQSDTIHVKEEAQELICDAVENFLLGGAIDTKTMSTTMFKPYGTTGHTFSTNSLVTGLNNGTAWIKNNQPSIVMLNGTTVYYNGNLIPIAIIEDNNIIGRDDFPCQYPVNITIQKAGGTSYVYLPATLIFKDTTMFLSIQKLKDDGSNWLDADQPAAIIIPAFYYEHTLCAGI